MQIVTATSKEPVKEFATKHLAHACVVRDIQEPDATNALKNITDTRTANLAIAAQWGAQVQCVTLQENVLVLTAFQEELVTNADLDIICTLNAFVSDNAA